VTAGSVNDILNNEGGRAAGEEFSPPFIFLVLVFLGIPVDDRW
jgi:hypothetical protein